MRFSTDADLLQYEPAFPVDLPFAGEVIARLPEAVRFGNLVTCEGDELKPLKVGNVLTLHAADTTICRAVLSVNGGSFDMGDINGLPAKGINVTVRSFDGVANTVAAELLAGLGMEPGDSACIVSVTLLRRLEALGTLARLYAGAVSMPSEEKVIGEKAECYRRRFQAAANGARVLIDLDGDGRADVWRTPGVGRLIRA